MMEFHWLQHEAQAALARARFTFREGVTAYYPAAGGEAYPNCFLPYKSLKRILHGAGNREQRKRNHET